MIDYRFFYWGPLLFCSKVKTKDIQKIKKLCKKDPKKSHVKYLAGDIKDEYVIDNKVLNKILSSHLDAFRQAHKHWYNKDLSSLIINQAWVNYMKPKDYNPIHTHGSCDFSGVLYIDIPKKLQKEMSEYKGTSDGPASILFLYGEESPQNITSKFSIPVVGDFYLFPHTLRHMVNPHKSDCERVSIGINLAIKGGIHDK